MSEIKLEQAEIDRLVNLRESYNRIIFDLGQINLQEHTIQTSLEEIVETKKRHLKEYADLRVTDEQLTAELTKKYGIGTIDVDKGLFIPGSDSK